jgi:hypothetical protein
VNGADRRVHFERHRDDEYIDEVVLRDGAITRLSITIAPRYKTSGMSGDEWRISALIAISDRRGNLIEENGSSGIRAAAARASSMVFAYPKGKLSGDDTAGGGVLELRRKGLVVLSREYGWFASEVASLPWTLILGAEDDAWKQVNTDALCFQVGCAEPFTNEYRLKNRFDREGNKVPPPSWAHYHRRFCSRHAERGDCGLEDADTNYELISGHGPGGARPEPGDVRESIRITVDGAALLADPRGTVDAAVATATRPASSEGRDG